jgi:hypothetical protein
MPMRRPQNLSAGKKIGEPNHEQRDQHNQRAQKFNAQAVRNKVLKTIPYGLFPAFRP